MQLSVSNLSYVRNATTDAILARRVVRASSAWSRTVGFIGRKRITPDEGMWFDKCCAIHTVGLRVPIDVLFLDRAGRVLEIAVGVPPARLAIVCTRAYSVLELGHGAIAASDILLGDQMVFHSA